MIKNKKKAATALSVLLAVSAFVISCTFFTFSASAAIEGIYTYQIAGSKACITDVEPNVAGDITLPSTLGGYPVESIDDFAFLNCPDITSVTIPDTVKVIGRSAFSGCSGIRVLSFPASIESVDEWAFYGCVNIEAIFITDLGAWCETAFTDKHANPLYSGENASLYLNGTRLSGHAVIPDGTERIGVYAFCGSSDITDLQIPSSVKTIESRAFYGCSSLMSVDIPVGVNLIGESTFYGCSSLISVQIPEGVTEIGANAFGGCGSLVKLTLPKTVTYLGSGAFAGCENLRRVYITDLTAWCFASFADPTSNPLYYGASLYLNNAKVSGTLTIPEGVLSIPDYAFYGCNAITSALLPDNLTSIGEGAFKECFYLESINIPSTVNKIGAQAFYDCNALKSVAVPDAVTK